jgi:peptide/nickel transport system ATP-binding protein
MRPRASRDRRGRARDRGTGEGLWRRRAVPQGANRARGRDVNLVLRKGETLGIVGESGSGKTTVARCVARLVDPTAGAIRDRRRRHRAMRQRALRPYRRRVQVVFQDPYRSLNPRRTVGASIVEGPMNFGLWRARGAGARPARLKGLVGQRPRTRSTASRTSSPAASASASPSPARSPWSRRC